MNAAPDTLAVVKARLPYTDRGSFSQAWFSALHLSAEAASCAPMGRVHRPLDANARVASDARRYEARERAASAASSPARVATAAARRDVAGETGPSRTLTRQSRIARSPEVKSSVADVATALATQRQPHFQTTLVLGDGAARVQLLLRRQGETIHVVALCSARNVPLVQRALVAARASLLAAGQQIDGDVRAVDEETLS